MVKLQKLTDDSVLEIDHGVEINNVLDSIQRIIDFSPSLSESSPFLQERSQIQVIEELKDSQETVVSQMKNSSLDIKSEKSVGKEVVTPLSDSEALMYPIKVGYNLSYWRA